MRHLCFPDLQQHDIRFLVGEASPIDFLQSKQGGAHQQARMGTCIGKRNDGAATILQVLAAEAIGLGEHWDSIANATLGAQLFRSTAWVACHRFAQIRQGMSQLAERTGPSCIKQSRLGLSSSPRMPKGEWSIFMIGANCSETRGRLVLDGP